MLIQNQKSTIALIDPWLGWMLWPICKPSQMQLVYDYAYHFIYVLYIFLASFFFFLEA